MLMLAISKNSFHYKYFLALRKLWSFEDIGYSSERTSLCIYTQFLFWFSMLTALVSPILFLGWLFIKLARGCYKICSWTPVGRKLLDFLDYFGLGRGIDVVSNAMIRDPARTLMGFCCKVIFTTLTIAIILAMLLGGIIFIKTVLIIMAAFFLVLTLAAFYIFFVIGWILAHLLICIKIAAIWSVLFVVAHIVFIAWIAGVLAISTLVSYISVKIVISSEKLRQFLGFKLNGYHKARSDNAIRREGLRRLADIEKKKLQGEKRERKQKKDDGEIPYSLLEKVVNGFESVGVSCINWCGEFFVARTKNVKGGTYKVVTGFGVIWETLKSLYHGVCPLVEFVDEDEEEKEEE